MASYVFELSELLRRLGRGVLNLRTTLTDSSYAKNAGEVVFGNAIGQMISLFSVPLQSRIYGPELVGQFAAFGATSGMVSGFACLGLLSAIMSPKEEREASAIVRICLLSSAVSACLVICVGLGISPDYKVADPAGGYWYFMLALGGVIVLSNWASAAYTWALRNRAYRLLRYNPIIGSLVNLTALVLFAQVGLRSYGLILASVVSQMAILVSMLIGLRPQTYSHTARELLSVLSKYRDFPIFQMPSNMLRTAGGQLPILMMSSLYGTSFLGQYSMAQRLLFVPITLVAAAVGQVHFQRATEMSNEGISIAVLTERVVRSIMLLTFIPLLVVAAFGRFGMLILLGPEWGLAGTILEIRTVEFFLTSVMYSISSVFIVLGRQRLNLLYTGVFLLCNLGVIILAGYFKADAIAVSISLSSVATVMNVGYVVVALRYVGARWLHFALACFVGCACFVLIILVSILLGGSR